MRNNASPCMRRRRDWQPSAVGSIRFRPDLPSQPSVASAFEVVTNVGNGEKYARPQSIGENKKQQPHHQSKKTQGAGGIRLLAGAGKEEYGWARRRGNHSIGQPEQKT